MRSSAGELLRSPSPACGLERLRVAAGVHRPGRGGPRATGSLKSACEAARVTTGTDVVSLTQPSSWMPGSPAGAEHRQDRLCTCDRAVTGPKIAGSARV